MMHAVNPKARLATLDSLRGIAAFVIVLHHFGGMSFCLRDPGPFAHAFGSVFSPAWIGRAAVMLFFALSGFVLALPYANGSATSYQTFTIRRICRIYLPYLGALGLAILGFGLFHDKIDVSASAKSVWSGSIDARSVLDHVLFIGRYDTYKYNIAFWSLVHEMRISLVFPLIAYVAFRAPTVVGLLCAAVLAVSDILVPQLDGSFHYAAIFLLAAMTVSRHKELYDRISAESKHAWVSLLVALGVILGLSRIHTALILTDTLMGLAGIAIILHAIHNPAVSRWLSTRGPLWLGNVSYSTYLLHTTILFSLLALAHGAVPFIAILPVYLLAVGILSHVYNRTVEINSIALGRILTRPKAIAVPTTEAA